MNEPTTNKPPFNGDQLFKVMRYYFEMFTKSASIAPDNRALINPGAFIQWLREYDNPDTGLHPLSDCVADTSRLLDVSQEAIEFVIRLGISSTGLSNLMVMWPYLVLQGRQTRNEIRSMQMIFAVCFVDGNIAPLAQVVHRDNPGQEPMTDASAIHFISHAASVLNSQLLTIGIDGLHDGNTGYYKMGCADILTKIMLTAEDAMKAGSLTPADVSEIGKLVKYVGTLFPEKLPESVLRQMQQPAGQASAKAASGGWAN